IPRMDLGSVRVPVPENCQAQVEMDQETGNVRAVHVVTPHGQVPISAYAAPKTSERWPEVCVELAEQLRSDGAIVRQLTGDWGKELSAKMGDVSLHFVGVDGPRWMLRGVIAGPQHVSEGAPAQLRALVRETIVVRGSGPMPVRTPLPITLPPAMAEAIAEQRGQAGGALARGGACTAAWPSVERSARKSAKPISVSAARGMTDAHSRATSTGCTASPAQPTSPTGTSSRRNSASSGPGCSAAASNPSS